MNRIRNLKMAGKLGLAFAALIVLMAVAGGIGLHGQSQVNGRAADVAKHADGLNHIQEANGELLRISRAVRNALLDKDAASVDKRAADIRQSDARFRAEFDAYRQTLVREDMKAKAAELDRQFNEVRPLQDEIVALAREQKDAEATARLPRIRALADSIEEKVNAMVDAKQELIKEAKADADATAVQSRWMIVGALAVGCVMAVVLGVVLSRLTARPLMQTVAVLEGVAKGDLSQRAQVDSRDEIGRMATALNAAIATLQAARERDADFQGQLAAISKAQAVIEFKLDGTVVTANDNFLSVLGYRLEEIQGRHHSTFVEPASASSHEYKEFWAKLNRGEYVAAEFKRIGKGGKEVWIQASYNPIFDASGKPYKVVKYATDITAAKLKNADYEGQLAAINKAQAVIEFKLDGTIVHANDNFLAVMGYALSEIQGRHHSTFVEPASASSHEYKEFWAKLNRGEYVAAEFKRIGKGGKEVWIQASYNPIFDASGKPYKVVKYATDITAAKNLERKVKEDAAELQQKVTIILTTVNALAGGDFTQQIPDLGIDAVGQMSAALNKAITAVRTALEGVREVSEQLADASGQLASASEEIATGAQEQASSLEETASTLEEITATVKQNSDSAQQARQLASGSKDVAEKGGQVVGHAVEAMSEINQSSKKIAEIITAIDEIAFQTNLLALNAAVEAARAGEQGRGFAVVASEVRNLAQRSATAAKEIKSLIQDSVKKVDAGTELVNRSGATLNEIVTSVKRVTDIVTEIAAASREQSTGIDQVNKAVTQMDSVTQRNASQTEEMSATAQTLTEQAGQLRDLVAQFKLGNHSSGRVAVRPAAPQAKNGHPKNGHAAGAKPRAVSRPSMNGHELDRLAPGGEDGFSDF